jgi:hypothetical protein
MSRAQDRLVPLVEWVKASSLSEMAPLQHDHIVRGPLAVFVSSALDTPPVDIAAGHLPLYIPATQAVPGMPSFDQPAPANQASTTDRLRHLLWMFASGRFEGALVALTDRYESLQSAKDRQVPLLDLAEIPILFVPLYALDLAPADYAFVAGKLPFVAG